ncbi:MAG: hypothetical protein ACYSU0_04010 [Planctomycetota bacterium]
MNRRKLIAAGVVAGLLCGMIPLAVLWMRRRPGPAECESIAVAQLYDYAFAQAAYSLHDWQGDGVHRFATDIRDLHYKELQGKPAALIPKEIADADSPSSAYKGYYFAVIPADGAGPIDPRRDFAVCALPIYEDCRRYICRGTVGVVYMEDERLGEIRHTRHGSVAIKVFPGLREFAERWIPIGFAGFVRIRKAGVVEGCEWPGKEDKILTLEDFEERFRKRRSGRR